MAEITCVSVSGNEKEAEKTCKSFGELFVENKMDEERKG